MTIYIFGRLGLFSYSQYLEDDTRKVFKVFHSHAKAESQLAIHRNGQLMYYGYLRKLGGSKYIGICVVVNGVMYTSVKTLFRLFEQGVDYLARKGELFRYDKHQSVVPMVKNFANHVVEVVDFQDKLEALFRKTMRRSIPLPSWDSRLPDSTVKTYTIEDDNAMIEKATHTYGYTFVYKYGKIEPLQKDDVTRNGRSSISWQPENDRKWRLREMNKRSRMAEQKAHNRINSKKKDFDDDTNNLIKNAVRYLMIGIPVICLLFTVFSIFYSSVKRDKVNCSNLTHKTISVKGVSFDMVYVEGGAFNMGATKEQENYGAEDNEFPVHKVVLNDYYIGQTEVTEALWTAIMREDSMQLMFRTDCPVCVATWDTCQIFIEKLNAATGYTFSLPTEAEWEYAARGGKHKDDYVFSGSDNLNKVGWCVDNSGGSVHPVATKGSNSLGIYDMSGNVWEWCQDWGGDYASEKQYNPTGEDVGTKRVIRGGSWYDTETRCRVSYRAMNKPNARYKERGLRLVLRDTTRSVSVPSRKSPGERFEKIKLQVDSVRNLINADQELWL